MLISEIAKMAGLSKDGIRHYEEMGLIASVPRRAGSKTYREYDPSVLRTIEKVRGAQRLGFTLKEIGPLLKAYADGPPTNAQGIKFLEERLVEIRKRIASLREVEDYIGAKLKRYRALASAKAPKIQTLPPKTRRATAVSSVRTRRERVAR